MRTGTEINIVLQAKKMIFVHDYQQKYMRRKKVFNFIAFQIRQMLFFWVILINVMFPICSQMLNNMLTFVTLMQVILYI